MSNLKNKTTETSSTGGCYFIKKRTGRHVLVPAGRIWVVDISYLTGDTMVRTFDGDIIVEESFNEVVDIISKEGCPIGVFSRQEDGKPIGVPVARIERIEKSERDNEGATLVITADGIICVSQTINKAVDIVNAGGKKLLCLFHKLLDDGNPTYILYSKINGISESPINGKTVVKCGNARIVVTEDFQDACEAFAKIKNHLAP